MFRLRQLLPLFALWAATGALVAAEFTDAEWTAMKKSYLEKPRRTMIDDDGCDAVNFPVGKEPSVENFYAQMLDKMPGNEFDVLVYCPGTVGFSVLNRTSFGDRQLGVIMPDRHRNITKILEEKFQTDPLELARKFARKNGYEWVINMRVNDIHDCWYPEWMPEWKRQNPQFLCGTATARPPHGYWTSYDFAHREVRDRFAAYVKEWIDNYDPDGIMIDFFRSAVLFKSVAWGGSASRQEIDGFTGMLRELRDYAERAGRKRGRPIYFAFRLPDTPSGCRAIGADVEGWAREKLFDIFIAGSDQARMAPWEDAAAFCKKNGLRFFASIDSSFINASPAVFNRNSIGAFDGDVAAASAAGAEGIYYFNMFYQMHYFPRVRRDAKALATADKTYFVNRHGSSPSPFPPTDGVEVLTPLYQGQPLMLTYGKPRTVKVEIGDDFRREFAAGEMPKARLTLKTAAEHLAVRINGQTLTDGTLGKDTRSWPVPLAALRQGVNRVELELASQSGAAKPTTLLAGDRLLTGANQPPWRRLFPGNAVSGAEKIADGAYWLTSSGKGAVNFSAALEGVRSVDFELLVQPESAPGTSVFRIADGRSVEVLEFRPDAIRGRFSGKTVPFNTTDRFHHYQLRLKDGTLTLLADGAPLLQTALPDNAGSAATKMQGYHMSLPDMHRTGLLLGSLNPTGRGAGAWKNVRVASESVPVLDLALEVKFPHAVDRKLSALGAAQPKWDFDADFSTGTLPALPGLSNGYCEVNAAPGGAGIVLDNDRYEGAAMSINALPFATRRNRYLIVDWAFTPLRAPRAAEHQQFQMLLRPARLDRPGHYEFMIRSVDGLVITAHETVAVPRGPQKLRAVIDAASGEFGVFLDGTLLTAGVAGVQDYGAGVTWGDISRSISGAAALKYVRVAAVPFSAADNPVAGYAEPAKWDYAADFSAGDHRIPPPVKSRYRKLVPAADGTGILLDQDQGSGFDAIVLAACPLVEKRGRYCLAEWEVVPVRAPVDRAHGVFQFALRPLPPQGEMPYEFVVNSDMDGIRTPWGRFPAPGGGKLRAAVDLRAGYGAVFLNGRLLAHGRLAVQKNKPGIYFGDNSSGISGAVVLKSVKLTWID